MTTRQNEYVKSTFQLFVYTYMHTYVYVCNIEWGQVPGLVRQVLKCFTYQLKLYVGAAAAAAVHWAIGP